MSRLKTRLSVAHQQTPERVDAAIRPFIFQDREPIEFTALTETSDEGFRREKFLYGVRARYRLIYGYWQYAVLSTFA